MTTLLQNTVGNITVYLENKNGSPALALTGAAVSFQLKKETENAFTVFFPTHFTELGNGNYDVGLSNLDTNTLGNLYLQITGTTIKTFLSASYVTDTPSIPPEQAPTPPNTVGLFGFILDITGVPIKNAPVYARLLGAPVATPADAQLITASDKDVIDVADNYLSATKEHTTLTEDTQIPVAISIDSFVTKTDANGYFFLSLMVGIDVDVVIPATNFRRTLTVPPTSTNLFEIP